MAPSLLENTSSNSATSVLKFLDDVRSSNRLSDGVSLEVFESHESLIEADIRVIQQVTVASLFDVGEVWGPVDFEDAVVRGLWDDPLRQDCFQRLLTAIQQGF
eukprot:CAMPEP_0204907750 /NCGR_PEP_ID=MMETSP1397-20131031/6823_1 /ASSEMBLY_ACC=CAM_ASM_000891 /TAXON_ID=49980 /ORGANISM="Climacostomum Climacostomum virens, Strain Stock W-24" /LENGTH=102 /DNA_ID=CAMNT_0052077005 /DNA_START=756 /DNA_END=1064 /DNA_ORIENTATION=+